MRMFTRFGLGSRFKTAKNRELASNNQVFISVFASAIIIPGTFSPKIFTQEKKIISGPLVKKFLFVTDSMLSIVQVLIEKVDEYSIIPY